MGYDVNWSLFGIGPDIGQRFQEGLEHGQAVRRESDTRNALAAYATNPDDPRTINALAAVSPEMAIQARGQQETRAARLQATQQQQHAAALEQHRDRINLGAKLFEQYQVKDQASYDQAKQAMAQYGYDVSDVPPQYDPAYVDGVKQLGRANAPAAAQGPNIQREVDYYRSIGRPELADKLLVNHAEGQPFVVPGEPGTVQVYPRSALTGGAGGDAPRQVHSEEEFNALPPGTPFIAPDGSHRVKPGGPTQPASGTFPR
jgi:hypothetical protein